MSYNTNEEKLKSIELGFKGKTPPEFYEKWKNTNKVRQRLLLELFVEVVFIIVFISMCFISFWFIFMVLLGIFILYKNLYIWYDIHMIKMERFKEYMESNEQKD